MRYSDGYFQALLAMAVFKQRLSLKCVKTGQCQGPDNFFRKHSKASLKIGSILKSVLCYDDNNCFILIIHVKFL